MIQACGDMFGLVPFDPINFWVRVKKSDFFFWQILLIFHIANQIYEWKRSWMVSVAWSMSENQKMDGIFQDPVEIVLILRKIVQKTIWSRNGENSLWITVFIRFSTQIHRKTSPSVILLPPKPRHHHFRHFRFSPLLVIFPSIFTMPWTPSST